MRTLYWKLVYFLNGYRYFEMSGSDPITAIVVGATAAAGATAYSASQARKAADKQADVQQQQIAAEQEAARKAEQERQEAVTRKEEALKEVDYPSILETEAGKKLYGTLQERIAGQGVGLGLDLNKETAPTAAQIRSSLKEQTIPTISAAASARGLGRSSVPVSQISQASQQAERDIESAMSELRISDAEARRLDVLSALQSTQQLTEREATDLQNRARLILGSEYDIANTVANNAELEKQDSSHIASLVANQGVTAAANDLQFATILGSGISSAVQNAALASQLSNQDLIDAINQNQKGRVGAQVLTTEQKQQIQPVNL